MLALQPNILKPSLVPLLGSLWRGAVLVVGGFALSKYALPYLFRMVAKAPELVLVSALGWCFFLAGAASLIGLSREMGALIAGVSLSAFPYTTDVVAKAVSIRDFFVTLFFVALGMQITIPSLHVLELALAASVFVIVSRVVVVPILYALRLGLRTSIVPAINLAQVSEFSIVIASLGVTMGQINQEILTVVIITFAVTSVVSTYMINFSHRIQSMLASAFKLVGLRDLRLMRSVHNISPNARMVLTTDHIPQALKFYEEGADFVFVPRLYSAAACARILRKGLLDGFQEVRSQAIGHLSKRQEVLA